MPNHNTFAALRNEQVKDEGDLIQHLREGVVLWVLWGRAQAMAHQVWGNNLDTEKHTSYYIMQWEQDRESTEVTFLSFDIHT